MEDDMKFACAMGISMVILLGVLVWEHHQDTKPKPTIDDYFYAISLMESNDDPNADHAGDEVGQYGITYAFWYDAIEFSGIGGQHSDCINPAYAQAIMIAYYRRYAINHLNNNNWYALARIHHGGWNGLNKKHTESYADNVINLINQEVKNRETNR